MPCVKYHDMIQHSWQKRLVMMVCKGSSKLVTHTADLASKLLTGRNIKVKSAEGMVHVKYIKEKIAASTHELSSHIDDSFHKALEQIMLEQSPRIKSNI